MNRTHKLQVNQGTPFHAAGGAAGNRKAQEQPWILQEFREGRRITHPVFRDDGSVEMMQGRVRLCPYFFTDNGGNTAFGGCLATIVPADKKKIHGMSDGVLVPCMVG